MRPAGIRTPLKIVLASGRHRPGDCFARLPPVGSSISEKPARATPPRVINCSDSSLALYLRTGCLKPHGGVTKSDSTCQQRLTLSITTRKILELANESWSLPTAKLRQLYRLTPIALFQRRRSYYGFGQSLRYRPPRTGF